MVDGMVRAAGKVGGGLEGGDGVDWWRRDPRESGRESKGVAGKFETKKNCKVKK
jgi:hypothetical protein